jgi:uncharacterized DUF497 family protein
VVVIAFDPVKRKKNLAKHGLDLADAGSVFAGAIGTRLDTRHRYGEDRYLTIGRLAGRLVVMVWTPRFASRRIISMRYAHAKEEALYIGREDG